MSILVPVVSHGVSFNEIPDRLSFYFEIGNCHAGCKGCHSPHLHADIEKTSLEDMVKEADAAIEQGAKAILLMGGTTNGIPDEDLIAIIDALGEIAPVCLYSGSDDIEHDMAIGTKADLTWLKTGSYKEECGGLASPSTNQKFFKKGFKYTLRNWQYVSIETEWEECTEVFRK